MYDKGVTWLEAPTPLYKPLEGPGMRMYVGILPLSHVCGRCPLPEVENGLSVEEDSRNQFETRKQKNSIFNGRWRPGWPGDRSTCRLQKSATSPTADRDSAYVNAWVARNPSERVSESEVVVVLRTFTEARR